MTKSHGRRGYGGLKGFSASLITAWRWVQQHQLASSSQGIFSSLSRDSA